MDSGKNTSNKELLKPYENHSTAELHERLKELNCIYRVNQLSENKDQHYQSYLQSIADSIPAGFHYPESTYVRIQLNDATILTTPFEETSNSISEEIDIDDYPHKCIIEVFNKENHPFLQEERPLLKNISRSVKQFISSKFAIETIKKNESRLRNLVNSQTSYVLRTDLEGRHTYWNHKFEEDFGWLYSERGLSYEDSIQSVCSYHHKRLIRAVKKCLKEPEKTVKVELDKPAKNDGIITTLWEFVCLTDTNGTPSEIQCIGIDITEQVNAIRQLEFSEKRFSNIARVNQTVIWETDIDGMFTYISPICEDLYGYTPTELIGKKYEYDLYTNDDIVKFKNDLKLLFDNGSELKKDEFEANRKDGTRIWISKTIAPIYNSDGVLKGYQGSDIDISARKKAEESLNQFKVITDSAHYGVAISDLDGTLTYVNKQMADIHGQNMDDLIGKNLTIFHTPEQLEKVQETLATLYREGGFIGEEVYHIRKDGSAFPALMNGAMIFNTSGEPLYFSATAIDITESKQQQEQIHKQNARMKAILEAIPDLLFITDVAGDIIEVYDTNVPEYFLKEKIKVGENVSTVYPNTDVDMHLNKIAECLDKNILVTYEYSVEKDHDVQYYEARLARVNAKNALHFVRNITSQKNSIKEISKLYIAIKQSPVAILVTDTDGYIEYTSPAFFKITGYKNEEIVGQHTRVLQSGETAKEVYLDLWKTISSGKTWNGEWLNAKKSGELFWEQVSISPIVNESGKIEKYLAIKEDITHRKVNEQKILELNQNLEKMVLDRTLELEKARADAEKANKAKSEFLSRMSHELRTPMNAILGFSQLIEMATVDEKQHKWVGNILKSGQHLLNLINEVLDISRIEAGRISISLEAVDCSNCINEVLETVSPLASQENIHIYFEQQNQQSYNVFADKQRLIQVLLNLINNAIKYNEEGGKVIIRVSEKGEPTNRITRIEVVDNGPGISKNDQEKIFNPFERIGAEKTQKEGTGLGLSVAQKLVTLMNGEIGVISTIHEGSTFWVELPSWLNQANTFKEQQVKFKRGDTNQAKTGVLLYIEDNSSNIELVEQILENARTGIQLISSLYGKEAAKMALIHKPDLILLDLNLPDIHGSQVLEQLKRTPFVNQIPVVIISADAMPNQVQNLLSAGAKSYLTKPIEIQQFLTVIDQFFK